MLASRSTKALVSMTNLLLFSFPRDTWGYDVSLSSLLSGSETELLGIFNESTLRHCATSISHDIEGYKALIARPYESVNRAMPGSYYSDVERTIFLTFVILSEDIAKYDELFQVSELSEKLNSIF